MTGRQASSTLEIGPAPRVLITCASFEERCLGVPTRLPSNGRFASSLVCVYDDESELRERHLKSMQGELSKRGPVQLIPTSESDPVPSTRELVVRLREILADVELKTILVDISTFTKRHMLLLLRFLDEARLLPRTAVYYTEPQDYVTDLYLPMSFGLASVSAVPGFIASVPLSRPTLLVVFLGYDGDRARAIYENLDPDEVRLVVPRPAYRPEWEQRTEHMNRGLIDLIGEGALRYADSRDAQEVADQLATEILPPAVLEEYRCSVAPLGTKPQALGLYLFWRQVPRSFSIIYAQPLMHNEAFYSTGVGPTRLLLRAEA